MDEMTFGKTPAAMYLARTLNELDNKSLSRSVGRSITATTNAVAQLMHAYGVGVLSPKVLANTLRLMRLEISPPDDEFALDWGNEKQFSDEMQLRGLVDKLTKNVCVGVIKSAIRTATVASKAERVMVSPEKRGFATFINDDNFSQVREFSFYDKQLDKEVICGSVALDRLSKEVDVYVYRPQPEDVDTITPELLVERSNRRCKRQGKPHMEGV
jgi:hypothetical protein